MNTESLKHHLITVVLGYDFAIEDESGEGVYTHKDGDHIYKFLWDPIVNIEQAMGCFLALGDKFSMLLCVEKLDDLENQNVCYINTNRSTKMVGKGTHKTNYAPAICLAIAKATGWKE